MKMTLYAPGDKWPGGDDGDPDADKANETFNLPRFASLQIITVWGQIAVQASI